MKTLYLVISILAFKYSTAKTYYFSSTIGNDNNTSIQAQVKNNPWKSISKLNSFFSNLNPGDSVLFKRGEIFYGSIAILKSGTNADPIVFSTYGTGEKPVITGFTQITSWVSLGSNIWESRNAVSELTSANRVVINGINTAMGRHPNIGWNGITTSSSTSITSSGLSDKNWKGAEVVIKKINYVIDKSKIISHSGAKISFTNNDYPPINGWGYFIQNHPQTLDSLNEWYYDSSTKKLRIYSTSVPENVQITTLNILVSIYGKDHIVFDNISFQGTNENAFSIGSSKFVTIQNCSLGFCGEQAIYGENWAFENYSSYLKVLNNNFSHNSNKDIYLESYFRYARIANNVFKNTGLVIGSNTNAEPQSTAICSYGFKNIIEGNTLDSIGYIGIYFMGDSTVVKNNVVSNFCLNRDDGGGIYTAGYPPATMQEISDNIVLNGIGCNDGTPNKYNALYANGIYVDDYATNVQILRNSIANCSNSGILLHNARNISVKNNVSYNNTVQILFQSEGDQLREAFIANNVFCARTINQHTASFKTHINDISNFGKFESNYYVRPVDDTYTIQTVEENWMADNYRTLDQWKSIYNKDSNSQKSPKVITDVNHLRFEYNATSFVKNVSLDDHYIDLKGVAKSGDLKLAPFSSIVLIKANTDAFSEDTTSSLHDAQEEDFRVILGAEPDIFAIYPNPTYGNTITLNHSNLIKGTYSIMLINNIGQVCKYYKIEHNGGTLNQRLHLAPNFPNGIYHLQINVSNRTVNLHFIKE